TDNGPCFISKETKEYFEKLSIKHQRSTPYRPSSQGLVERVNRTIGTRIKMFAQGNEKQWDEELHDIVLSYNATHFENLNTCPFKLIFNLSPRTPLENKFEIEKDKQEDTETIIKERKRVKDKLLKQQEERIAKAPIKPIPFKVGDFVRKAVKYLDRSLGKKLTPVFKGTYVVTKVYDSTAVITDPKTLKEFKVNFENLKKIHHDSDPENTEESNQSNTDSESEKD
ncbi:uncharacterized protein LOC107365539, partial [Tetranychus urticae]|uniref:uncharacterized protein LOC107365539 n=1 Tax=Tetranychus urticae TaxID=32264 RepID=UPI00077BF7A9